MIVHTAHLNRGASLLVQRTGQVCVEFWLNGSGKERFAVLGGKDQMGEKSDYGGPSAREIIVRGEPTPALRSGVG